MAVISAEAPSRWLFSAVAALAAHGALLLGSPDVTLLQVAAAEPLWMSIEVGPAEGTNAGSSGASPAHEPVAKAVPVRHLSRPRASASAHVPAEAPTPAPAAPEADAAGEVAALSASAGTGNSEGGSNSGVGRGDAVGAGSGAGVGSGTGLVGMGQVVKPALIASRNPCDGFFPAGAQVDHGRVQIQVHVDELGHVSVSEVVVEAPLGHDFGSAARACASALRFAPARDALGSAVAGDAKLELTFHRS